MKGNSRTLWLGIGVGAALALAALVYRLSPPLIRQTGIDSGDLGGGVLAALILWLTLRGDRPPEPKRRILAGSLVTIGLLLGLALHFLA